jgi:hypothetical protein
MKRTLHAICLLAALPHLLHAADNITTIDDPPNEATKRNRHESSN